MKRDLAAFLIVLVYGVGVGVILEKNDVPRKLAKRASNYVDDRARHIAGVMTDEAITRQGIIGGKL